jgi:hypothetical protein
MWGGKRVKTGSRYAPQDGLKHTDLLSQPPECWITDVHHLAWLRLSFYMPAVAQYWNGLPQGRGEILAKAVPIC